MASDLSLARDVLTKTDRRSYQHLWEEVRGRFTHVSKPTSRKPNGKKATRISMEAKSAAAGPSEARELRDYDVQFFLRSQPAKPEPVSVLAGRPPATTPEIMVFSNV